MIVFAVAAGDALFAAAALADLAAFDTAFALQDSLEAAFRHYSYLHLHSSDSCVSVVAYTQVEVESSANREMK